MAYSPHLPSAVSRPLWPGLSFSSVDSYLSQREQELSQHERIRQLVCYSPQGLWFEGKTKEQIKRGSDLVGKKLPLSVILENPREWFADLW